MASVTFDTVVGGDGSTVTDDDDPSTGLGNGGSLLRLVPMIAQVVNVAENVVNAATSSLGGATTNATSTTSLTIGTGSKSITLVESGKAYTVGQFVMVASTANPENYMIGQVTAFSGTSLTVNVTSTGGSGTIAAWSISVTGVTTTDASSLKTTGASVSVNSASPPTTGQILTATSSTNATWQSIDGSGLVLLSSVTANNSATVDIETGIDSTYDEYIMLISGLRCQTDRRDLSCRMKIDGSYKSADYAHSFQGTTIAASPTFSGSGNAGTGTEIILTGSGVWLVPFSSDSSADIRLTFSNPSDSSKKHFIKCDAYGYESSVIFRYGLGAGVYTGTAGALTGLRFFMSGSRNIATGTFRLYGVKK